MKTRIVVHIALNAKNEQVSNLVEVAGRLIPFAFGGGSLGLAYWTKCKTSTWIEDDWHTMGSLKKWKNYCKKASWAVRFQRITLIGESK